MTDPIEAAVFKCAMRLVRNVPVTKATTLHADLGMDSLDVVEFEMELGDELDMDVPPDFIRDHDTVGDVVKRLKALAGKQRAHAKA